MALRIDNLCIDASDPRVLGEWWAELLGWKVADAGEDEFSIQSPEDGRELLFCRVPERKGVKNRLHLDLRPDDQAAEVARAEKMGARRVDVGQGEQTWVVLADPEGNEFCILSPL
jgi:hypothetical protein